MGKLRVKSIIVYITPLFFHRETAFTMFVTLGRRFLFFHVNRGFEFRAQSSRIDTLSAERVVEGRF